MTLENVMGVLTIEILMSFSIVIFLGLSLIIWLKIRTIPKSCNVVNMKCSHCSKSIDIAYNSIGQGFMCPECGHEVNSIKTE